MNVYTKLRECTVLPDTNMHILRVWKGSTAQRKEIPHCSLYLGSAEVGRPRTESPVWQEELEWEQEQSFLLCVTSNSFCSTCLRTGFQWSDSGGGIHAPCMLERRGVADTGHQVSGSNLSYVQYHSPFTLEVI